MCNSYPEELIKGLPNQNCIDQETRALTPNAIQKLDPHHEGLPYKETSICWNDDEGVWEKMNAQKSVHRNDYQFRAGFAVFKRKQIDVLRKTLGQIETREENLLEYERHPTPTNRYHGNMLFHNEITKRQKREIIQKICQLMDRHVPFEESNSID